LTERRAELRAELRAVKKEIELESKHKEQKVRKGQLAGGKDV
jgi:hypothetical protein